MMDKTPSIGTNRTGIQMSPADAKKMQQVPPGLPFTPGDESGIDEMRSDYIKSSGPVGSVPPPGTAKGAVKAGMKALTGKRAQVFLDRIGERLAFERSGTRLYEAMITKCKAMADGGAAQRLSQLEHFCKEEAEHFRLLVGCMQKLGADPTAQTPCADVAGVESMGLMQVVTDPMTSVTQSIHAILVAELADYDGWNELISLSREFGQEEMASKFEKARDEEHEHLETIRQWHQSSTMEESKLAA